jgi:hypothetical protein
MADATKTADPLDQQWCCMTCSRTFRLGKMRMRSYCEEFPIGHACPHCGSGRGLHPADGTATELEAYHGERGTVQ